MIIDEKGKLFGKINVIDLIVILLVTVAVAGIGYKFTKSKSILSSGKPDKVCVEFYAEEAPEFAVDKVKINDAVGETEKGTTFGNVAYVNVDRALTAGQSASGEFIRTSRPGFSSVHLQVYGDGVVKPDGGVTINNIDWYVGKTVLLRAGNSTFQCRIYNLSKRG